MVTPSIGGVVLVRFPFSDLSTSKLRPAVVLASSGMDDWVLCQITSNPYSDSRSIEINDENFIEGALKRTSYARPGKLFTANDSLIYSKVGVLKKSSFEGIINSVINVFKQSLG